MIPLRRLALFLGILMSGGSFVFPRIPMLAVILVLTFMLKGPSLGIRKEMNGIWLLLLAILVVTMIGGAGLDPIPTATRYANFLGGILLLGIYIDEDRGTLSRDFFFLGNIFTVQAIVTLILSETLNGLFSVFPIRETDYHTIGFLFTYHVMLEDSTIFYRPDGFFFEPGIYQIYLNLTLYLALFVFKSRIWGAVALLAVLASQSTTGLIIGIALAAIYYIRLLPTATVVEKIAGIVLAPLIAIPLFLVAQENLSTKLTGVTVGSRWAREYDLYTGLRVVEQYPLTGIGFDYDRYYQIAARYGYLESSLSQNSLTERPNSNGVVTLFYSVGIPLALIFLFGLFRQRFFRHKLMIFALLMLSLGSEAVLLTPFFLMLVFSGLLVTRRVMRRTGTAVAPPRGSRFAAPARLPHL